MFPGPFPAWLVRPSSATHAAASAKAGDEGPYGLKWVSDDVHHREELEFGDGLFTEKCVLLTCEPSLCEFCVVEYTHLCAA